MILGYDNSLTPTDGNSKKLLAWLTETNAIRYPIKEVLDSCRHFDDSSTLDRLIWLFGGDAAYLNFEDTRAGLSKLWNKWKAANLKSDVGVLYSLHRFFARFEQSLEPWYKKALTLTTRTSGKLCAQDSGPQEDSSVKPRRGLRGIVSGKEMSALPDYGADHNIITAAFAAQMGLKIEGFPADFRLGNSKPLRSLGIARLDWSFAQEPSKIERIICHVIPQCRYGLILGRKFLKATRTLSKYRERLTDCLFPPQNATSINYLGNCPQRLVGVIGDLHQAFAIPDTGADRNVMDMQYAQTHGFPILTKPENLGYLQFADLSVQRTVGQVQTTWKFANGDVEPVTFEVLENSISDVILGDDLLWQNDAFNKHASSLIELDMDEEGAPMKLAPFGYLKEWQGRLKKLFIRKKLLQASSSCSSTASPLMDDTRERRRRDAWNFKNGFDRKTVKPEEREAEDRRRRAYEEARHNSGYNNQQIPRIPSIATSSLDSRSGRRRAYADVRNPGGSEGRRPRLPSIPTSTVDLRFEESSNGP